MFPWTANARRSPSGAHSRSWTSTASSWTLSGSPPSGETVHDAAPSAPERDLLSVRRPGRVAVEVVSVRHQSTLAAAVGVHYVDLLVQVAATFLVRSLSSTGEHDLSSVGREIGAERCMVFGQAVDLPVPFDHRHVILPEAAGEVEGHHWDVVTAIEIGEREGSGLSQQDQRHYDTTGDHEPKEQPAFHLLTPVARALTRSATRPIGM